MPPQSDLPSSRERPGPPPARSHPDRAVMAALLGASAIALAPILAVLASRWGQVGANTTALWRTTLALPVLAALHRGRGTELRHSLRGETLLPGLFFGIDLWLWHASMQYIAAGLATVLSNLTVVCVPALGWLLLRQRYDRRLLLPSAIALGGAALVALKPNARIVASLGVAQENYGLGNLLALATTFAYAGFQLSAQRARARHSALAVLFYSTLSASAVLWLSALISRTALFPQGGKAWAALAALALVCHVGGQGLILWSLGHLPAYVVALLLLCQPVGATLLGRLLLGQELSWPQAVGAAVVLGGLALSVWARRGPVGRSREGGSPGGA